MKSQLRSRTLLPVLLLVGQLCACSTGSALSEQPSPGSGGDLPAVPDGGAAPGGDDVGRGEPDADGDGVADARDNCPQRFNPGQEDRDGDGVGDACQPPPEQQGTVEHPFLIPGNPEGPLFEDRRDTRRASSDRFDVYPPDRQDESGPEYVYRLTLAERVRLSAWIAFPEPQGVDVDLHLLSSLEPLQLVTRGHYEIEARLDPGTYYLIVDSCVTREEGMQAGPYWLRVALERPAAGSPADPILLGGTLDRPLPLPFGTTDSRDTNAATSDALDSYPPNATDESGPEYVYAFHVEEEVWFNAALRLPEPDGVDIDLHLLDSFDPLNLLQRHNATLHQVLAPGIYYLVADTYTSGGRPRAGRYRLAISASPRRPAPAGTFNDYVLAAVDYLYANYRLLGYDAAVLTHDIEYGPYGIIPRSGDTRTMCVAAVMEVILTALQLYARDTGDATIWDFLPKRSWERLGAGDIKGHLWVNHDLNAGGSADALRNFGMGEVVPYEELRPGSFVNLNRTNGTGHAVVFLAFVDRNGGEHAEHTPGMVGFKYFSAQGGYNVGSGGLDYRYAVFDEHGAPEMPYRRDLHVIYSRSQRTLNTGWMWAPDRWSPVRAKPGLTPGQPDVDVSTFDAVYLDGRTADDPPF